MVTMQARLGQRETGSDAAPLQTLHVNTERTWRGGEQLTLTLARGLAARGHGVAIVAQPGSPMAECARSASMDVHEVAMRSEADLVAVFRIRDLVRRGRYDVLHFHTPHAVMLGGAASLGLRRRGRPVRVVNKRTDFSIYRNSFLGLNRLKYDRLVDCLIADSRKIGDVLRADGIAEDKIRVVYEGVDFSRLEGASGDRVRAELGVPAGAVLVGNVAHFAEHKGQVDLVRAIPHVLGRRPEAIFVLVGEGELLEPLRSLSRELGVERAVRFPGFRTDVKDCLAAFDVFVMSSREEGLCTSIIDAMFLSVPVVGTRAGGIPELVIDGGTGLLAPVADPSGLAEAIVQAILDRGGAKERAARARERVCSLFSADGMVDGTLAVYRDLLARSLAPLRGGA